MDVSLNDVPFPELFPLLNFPSVYALSVRGGAPEAFPGARWDEQELRQWLLEALQLLPFSEDVEENYESAWACGKSK